MVKRSARWRAVVSERPPYSSNSRGFPVFFPAHCLRLELTPISLRARQESGYEMETLVDYRSRAGINDFR
jgi:hypothetical protein